MSKYTLKVKLLSSSPWSSTVFPYHGNSIEDLQKVAESLRAIYDHIGAQDVETGEIYEL